MKSFLIGIILCVLIIFGGLTVVSFMNVDVPKEQINIEIPQSTPKITPSTQPLPGQ
jgi:uncharacterized protein YxeA